MAAIATRDSAAYKRYNEKLPAVKAESKSSLQLAKPPKKRRRKSLRRSVILSILAAVGASAYILYCQMQLTQLTAEVSKQSDNLSEMQAENVSLIEYVELTRPDVVTVAHSEHSLENVVSGLTEWFSSIVEYIR